MISLFAQAACCAALATAVPAEGALPAAAMVAQVTASGEAAKAADDFVNAVGVDTGFAYSGSPYVLQWPAISADLIDLGVRHIRDGGTPSPPYLARLATLNAHGIKHAAAFIVGKTTPEKIRAELQLFGPANVDFVEPSNEYDGNWKTDPDWATHIVEQQKVIYSTVHGDPAFAGITVSGPAMSNAKNYAVIGALDQYEDVGSIHWAPCDRNPGTADFYSIPHVHALIRASTQTKPIWTTETGYGDDMARYCTMADDVIAKYDPRTIAERWNAGEPRIYLFEFADMPTDKVFGSMGMVRADGTPKPQYTAMKSMLHLLADPGPAFQTTPLQMSFSGNTKDVHHTLLQRRDGRYQLLVWLEVPSFDHKARSAINVPSQAVSLSLPPSIRSAKVYTYTPSWTLTPAPLPIRGGTAKLQVTDTLSFVELSP